MRTAIRWCNLASFRQPWRRIPLQVPFLSLRARGKPGRPCSPGSTGSAADEIVPLVQMGGYGDIKETDHHLLIGLIAPPHCARGIRVVRIVPRVVVPGDGLEFRTR